MPRPLVLIHGYSAGGLDFTTLRDQLVARGIETANINIANYVSLNNEVTIKDIAEGLERAFQVRGLSGEFDAIVHSTGMLVLRSWLTNSGGPPDRNPRLARLKHLVGLAPATWGSPQAHKGRTWLGALVKGPKVPGPDFLNAGDQVLDGLELGGKFTWDLAHLDLLGDPYYDTGSKTPFVAVFIGNTPYQGLASVANDPGTDGTVRWAGCALNTRKIAMDLTRAPVDQYGKPATRFTISPWANNRLDIPMIAVDGRDHGSLVSNPAPEMMGLLVDFLKIGEEGGEAHEQWLKRATDYGEKAIGKMKVNPGAAAAGLGADAKKVFSDFFGCDPEQEMEGWQQFVVHARDERGDGITDFVVEVLTQAADGTWEKFQSMYTDVHAYGADPSYRCFYIRLPQGLSSGTIPLKFRIGASTGTAILAYQGYGSEVKDLKKTSEPVDIDVTDLGAGNGTLFYPFTTTLIEIVLNREPLPFDGPCEVLKFL
jgi:hypothetical protein